MNRIPNLERDIKQQQLISGVYNNLFQIAQQFQEPETISSSATEVQFVSFEQALKELVDLKKS